MKTDGCKQTYRALQENTCGEVPAECIEPLLLWLCGSRNGEAEEAFRILGSPFDDPVQRERVYRALDAVLFNHAELVQPEGEHAARQARFRLLSRAFHPDRYPDLFDWLGPRAQTINAAFHAFRKQPPPDSDGDRVAAREPAKPQPPARRQEKSFTGRAGLRERLISLCAPLANSRYLPQKILALTAIVCALPLLYLYHQHVQMAAYSYSWTAPVASPDGKAREADAAAGGDNEAYPAENASPASTPPSQPELVMNQAGAVGVASVAGESDLETVTVDAMKDAGVIGQQTTAGNAPAAAEEQAVRTAPVSEARTVSETAVAREQSRVEAAEETAAATPVETVRPARVMSRDNNTDTTVAVSARSAAPASAAAAASGGNAAPETGAVAVMDRFQASFERGELRDLLALFTPEPRENDNRGRPWFRRSYGELFENTRSRSLELDFSETRADGEGVRLVGRYAMRITYSNGRTASGSGPVQYRLVPREDGWKISAIDYRREK